MRHLLLFTLICNVGYGNTCNWKTIVKVDNYFKYPASCHLEVGRLVKTEKLRVKQVGVMTEEIRLKDLQIKVEVNRAQLWRKATIDMEGHYSRQRAVSEVQRYIWFGLGVLATGAAVYGAGRIR